MPKDFLSADLRNKAGITTKPFLVNLTFWEDRPRLNFWEKILLKRKQLAKQAKNEAKEEEISAYMAEVSIFFIIVNILLSLVRTEFLDNVNKRTL